MSCCRLTNNMLLWCENGCLYISIYDLNKVKFLLFALNSIKLNKCSFCIVTINIFMYFVIINKNLFVFFLGKGIKEDYPNYYAIIESGELPTQKHRRYFCKFCPYSTKTKQHITYHEVKHTGVRPFQCTLCDKTFSAQSSLRRHRLINHDANGYFVKDFLLFPTDQGEVGTFVVPTTEPELTFTLQEK